MPYLIIWHFSFLLEIKAIFPAIKRSSQNTKPADQKKKTYNHNYNNFQGLSAD